MGGGGGEMHQGWAGVKHPELGAPASFPHAAAHFTSPWQTRAWGERFDHAL